MYIGIFFISCPQIFYCAARTTRTTTDSSSCLQVATLGMRIYGKHGNASRMTASIAEAMHTR